MGLIKQLSQRSKAFFQLGFKQSANYLLYQAGLRSGYYKLATPALDINTLLPDEQLEPNWFMALPEKVQLIRICGQQNPILFNSADEILQKKMRFYGEELKTLLLAPEAEPAHWTEYERGTIHPRFKDIKDVWEPARFSWAIILGKAYYLSGSEKYARTFWQYFEEFKAANPINRGLNWTSAQEVALRMIALIISAHLLKNSKESTAERIKSLSTYVAEHASRIPPTLCYAKAQNNNHLLSEAVGLYTAAFFLPNHPKAAYWREKGLRWFEQAVETQIAADGTYIQYSTNYHRLMLMLCLWMQLLLEKAHLIFKDEILNKVASATRWLAARLDETSGQVPNLGHNDGSNILPFSNAGHMDYRPIVQAASRTFLAKPALKSGQWDDLCLWLEIPVPMKSRVKEQKDLSSNYLILGSRENWAAIQAENFSARPAHADQLHVDLWYKGVNIARDAGTYRYNAPPPWENSLAATCVHNTVTVNDADQMTRAGKFLWLDWAQAQVEEHSANKITAVHSGYRKLGILHRRTLRKLDKTGWEITDELLPTQQPAPEIKAALNWLIPDWPYQINAKQIELQSPLGPVHLEFTCTAENNPIDIFRGGESLLTKEKAPRLGWYSPTYGVKQPALSVQFILVQKAPIQIKSTFRLPE
jgi:hypothetical protein